MGDVRAEVPPDDTVPCGVILLVELFLDVRCNVFLDIVLFESLEKVFELSFNQSCGAARFSAAPALGITFCIREENNFFCFEFIVFRLRNTANTNLGQHNTEEPTDRHSF